VTAIGLERPYAAALFGGFDWRGSDREGAAAATEVLVRTTLAPVDH